MFDSNAHDQGFIHARGGDLQALFQNNEFFVGVLIADDIAMYTQSHR